MRLRVLAIVTLTVICAGCAAVGGPEEFQRYVGRVPTTQQEKADDQSCTDKSQYSGGEKTAIGTSYILFPIGLIGPATLAVIHSGKYRDCLEERGYTVKSDINKPQ